MTENRIRVFVAAVSYLLENNIDVVFCEYEIDIFYNVVVFECFEQIHLVLHRQRLVQRK